MKVTFLFLVLLATLGVNAQNVVGTWKTIDDETGEPKSIVDIYKKGDVYYGKILKLFRNPDQDQDPKCDKCDEDDPRYNQRIIGMDIIRSMTWDAEDEVLDDGDILDPKNGEVYDAKIWVAEDGNLSVRGYIMFLFRTQTWLPVK